MEIAGLRAHPARRASRAARPSTPRGGPGDVEVIFVEHDPFFDRRSSPYGVGSTDYPDNDLRFAFFARAALEYFRSRGLRPDIFNVHDWQAGLVPIYLERRPIFSRPRACAA